MTKKVIRNKTLTKFELAMKLTSLAIEEKQKELDLLYKVHTELFCLGVEFLNTTIKENKNR